MVKVGLAVEGCSLNGYEWVLEEEDGDIKWFSSLDEAEAFMVEAGADEDDLDFMKFVDENGEEVWHGKREGDPPVYFIEVEGGMQEAERQRLKNKSMEYPTAEEILSAMNQGLHYLFEKGGADGG